MHDPSTVSDRRARAVRVWLLAVAAMIFLTLVVGGATRLTESGLSITQWKPITGVVPPLSRAAWEKEFKDYQAIPQYKELNRGMSLAQFKSIYWWEWTHRLLARTVGFAFLLPFMFFLWRDYVPKHLRIRLWAIFGAGACLGVVGWWMVSSGLAGSGRVSVSQYRLAFHLTLACAIYAAVLWTAQQFAPRPLSRATARPRITGVVLVSLVLLQIYLGALVAGLNAGLVYNTWPLIDGSFIPHGARLWFLHPVWRNFFENRLTVQLDHRTLAYTIWLIALWHALDSWWQKREVGTALLLVGAVTMQALLGIVTLLEQAPIPLSQAHQIVAILVYTVAIVHAERLWHRETLRSSPVAAVESRA